MSKKLNLKCFTVTQRKAAIKIALQLTMLKAEIADLGLFQTMHAMDHPLYAIGYEIEAKINGKWPHDKLSVADVKRMD